MGMGPKDGPNTYFFPPFGFSWIISLHGFCEKTASIWCILAQGGFIGKRPEWVNQQKPDLFAIEDPQEPGKDVAGGSFQVREVRQPELSDPISVRSLAASNMGLVAVGEVFFDIQLF